MSAQDRTALVTGVGGQDGIYLARHLMSRGFHVVGTEHETAKGDQDLAVYLDGVKVVRHDVCDDAGFRLLLEKHRPAWIFNLAAFSSVGASWDQPELVDEVNGAAVERMLEALRDHRQRRATDVRFFQAGSAEESGAGAASPYARAKTRAHAATTRAREEHGLFACTAVLHNHESPLRPQRFVTRKITRAAAEVSLGLRESLSLGNLAVSRDWGSAGDYVDAMTRMLELDEPTDLVVATGVSHTLSDLVETAFAAAGVADPWAHVAVDQALVRPADAPALVADISEARRILGWEPTLTFEQVVEHMVAVDLERLRAGIEESTDYLYPR